MIHTVQFSTVFDLCASDARCRWLISSLWHNQSETPQRLINPSGLQKADPTPILIILGPCIFIGILVDAAGCSIALICALICVIFADMVSLRAFGFLTRGETPETPRALRMTGVTVRGLDCPEWQVTVLLPSQAAIRLQPQLSFVFFIWLLKTTILPCSKHLSIMIHRRAQKTSLRSRRTSYSSSWNAQTNRQPFISSSSHTYPDAFLYTIYRWWKVKVKTPSPDEEGPSGLVPAAYVEQVRPSPS